MKNQKFICVLCGVEKEGFGNNPMPLSEKGRCCDTCNDDVIRARIYNVKNYIVGSKKYVNINK